MRSKLGENFTTKWSDIPTCLGVEMISDLYVCLDWGDCGWSGLQHSISGFQTGIPELSFPLFHAIKCLIELKKKKQCFFRLLIVNLFTVPKPNRNMRPVLDLKVLNRFLSYAKITNWVSLVSGHLASTKGISGISGYKGNLSAHHNLQVCSGEKKPNPVFTSSLFTTVLGPLCSQGILTMGYLYNLLLREHSISLLESNVHWTIVILEICGWILIVQKPALVPQWWLECLGLMLYLDQSRVILLPSKNACCSRLGCRCFRRCASTLHTLLYEGSGEDGLLSLKLFCSVYSRSLQLNILSAWDKKRVTWLSDVSTKLSLDG